MELKIYAIYDLKAEAFMSPMFIKTDGLALRNVMGAMQDENTVLASNAEDFVLYQLGTFEDSTGEVVGFSPARHVMALDQLRTDTQPTLPGLVEDPEGRN